MQKQTLQKSSSPLQKAFLSLNTQWDVFNFLRDLCTVSEIEEFSQRLDIAYRLTKKESYKNIEKETSASSTTIARVAKFLKGKWWGYQKVIRNLEKSK